MKNMILLAIGIVAVSFSAIFIKWSEAPVSVIAMQRLFLAVLLMLPWVVASRAEIRSVSRSDWRLLSLSGLLLGLHFLLWMGSLRFTSVASSTVLLTLEPVLVMAGAWLLFRERTTAAALSGVAVAALGAILIGWSDFSVSDDAIKGDLLSVFGTIAVVGHMLLGQKLRERISNTVYTFAVFLTDGLMFLLYNAALGIPMFDYPSREWGLFVLMAIVPTVFGHLLFNRLLKDVGATTVSVAILGEPVGASLLAWWLLSERITPLQAAACALLIGGVVLFLAFHRRRNKEVRPHVPIAPTFTKS